MCNLDRPLQEKTLYGIYTKFSATRSGDFVGTHPKVSHHGGGGTRDYQCIRFQTYSHPDFKFYYDLFYPAHGALQYKGRKKRVPKNINELLTPRGLAYWFMDDGTSYRSGRHRAYRFSTHSFPLSYQ